MYKETPEYVFDLLENEYKKYYDSIQLIGKDNIIVYTFKVKRKPKSHI